MRGLGGGGGGGFLARPAPGPWGFFPPPPPPPAFRIRRTGRNRFALLRGRRSEICLGFVGVWGLGGLEASCAVLGPLVFGGWGLEVGDGLGINGMKGLGRGGEKEELMIEIH